MKKDVFILLTMDCETARQDITLHAFGMSASGPWDYSESERSIRGYASVARAYGFPLTLFVHPEVAMASREPLLELQGQGACLGLHLHPYKYADGTYKADLGAYSAQVQRSVLGAAANSWEQALGQHPLYFRSGYFSANDSTFRVLEELGFRGSSISNPGRVLPEHQSVWAGAEPYPHRAHLAFRQLRGMGRLVEVPISVDYERSVEKGAAGEKGYEWLYIPAAYNHWEIVRHLLKRAKSDARPIFVLVLDTHNDQDYFDHQHPARVNLDLILGRVESLCDEMDLLPVGATLESVCDLVLSSDPSLDGGCLRPPDE